MRVESLVNALLRPEPTVTEGEAQRSLRSLAHEALAAGAMYSLGSGGFMAAYALALGANSLQVGVLAALPFLGQVIRLPAILLVERVRRRKALGLPALLGMHLAWIPIGAVPFLLGTPGAAAVGAVIALLALRGLFASLWVTASTSWMRDLVPVQDLGSYFARREALTTVGAAVAGIGGSLFVVWWTGRSSPEDEVFAYSILLIGGVLGVGLFSPLLASRAIEPLMPQAERTGRSALAILREPLHDRNFTHLVRYLFAWSFASNLAVPFFAVYMLTALGLPLTFVVSMTVLSQATTVLFVRVWGPLADRAGSKPVLSLSSSLYLFVIVGWVLTSPPEGRVTMYALLAALHIFGGVAAAGVNLTANTLALKIAPEGKAVSFSGVAGIAAAVGAGVGPIVGGLLADVFLDRSVRIDLSWVSPADETALLALSLGGFDMLFVVAFVLGLLSLNLLVALREEGEVTRDAALAELMGQARPMMRAVSSMPGVNIVSTLSYGYLRRVPGADVALGVTAYQLAASTRAATASALRGQAVAQGIADRVRDAVDDTIEGIDDVVEAGSELARHATRGAMHAAGHLDEQVAEVAGAAVQGALRTLTAQGVEPETSIRGAAIGVVQGALEAGHDAGPAVGAAIEAAREAAVELGIAPSEAESAAAEGIVAAALAAGEPVPEAVAAVLPDESRPGAVATPSDDDGHGAAARD